MDKSKYRDGLRALRRYIPRLEQDLELLRAQPRAKPEIGTITVEENPKTCIDDGVRTPSIPWKSSEQNKIFDGQQVCSEDESSTESGVLSDSEDLADIFETDSETETQDEAKQPLYLDEFEKFPVQGNREPEDFEEHLRQVALESKKVHSSENDEYSPSFDEVDRMFLRAAALLKNRKR